MRKAVHVIVRGRVQGVGFRAFVAREAEVLGLDGWVRNRRNGTVELVLGGDVDAVDQMLALLRIGPGGSLVSDVAATPHHESVAPGFDVLPTE